MARRKKKKSKNWIWGILIVALMVFSGLGYMMSDDTGGPANYNGFSFRQAQNAWVTEVNGRQVMFMYHPLDLEDMGVDQQAIDAVRDAKIMYITYDPQSEVVSEIEVARMQVSAALQEQVFVVPGITRNSSQYTNFPLITCDNASQYAPVMVLEDRNVTEITIEGNCIHVSGSDRYDMPIVTERLLYGIYGVI